MPHFFVAFEAISWVLLVVSSLVEVVSKRNIQDSRLLCIEPWWIFHPRRISAFADWEVCLIYVSRWNLYGNWKLLNRIITIHDIPGGRNVKHAFDQSQLYEGVEEPNPALIIHAP